MLSAAAKRPPPDHAHFGPLTKAPKVLPCPHAKKSATSCLRFGSRVGRTLNAATPRRRRRRRRRQYTPDRGVQNETRPRFAGLFAWPIERRASNGEQVSILFAWAVILDLV